MRNRLIAIAVIMLPLCICAQDIRLLSMEEAVLGTGLRIPNIKPVWSDDGKCLTYRYEGNVNTINLATGVSTSTPESQEEATGSGNTEGYESWAYTKGNNIYTKDNYGNEIAITSYQDSNIVCGQAVSRNEFGIEEGMFMAPDGNKLAFYRKDESRVSSFPLLDITTRTGSLRQVKYPMNGMDSETISLGVYDRISRETVWMDVTDFTEERYLTNISWSPDSRTIYIQVLDRKQKDMHLNAYDAATGKFLCTLFTEHDDRYVEPLHKLVFIDSDPDRFIYSTNVRDGYRNLYLGNVSGGEPQRLTVCNGDVEYLCQRGNYIYYYSTEVSPVEQHLFRVSLKNGKQTRLTKEPGWHKCSVSPDGKWFTDNWSSLDVPRKVAYGSTDGKIFRTFFEPADPAAALNYGSIEMGTIKSADGLYDNWYRLIKPHNFDPTQKYPVILYVYGGPHIQLVTNSYQAQLRRWEMYMAQHGYIVFVMDGRGTPGHGAEYEKAIHRQCGKAEMSDQMEGIRWLMQNEWVDRERIGVHGWSYGGFMTISLMVNYPDIFKVGVAGGPVIDWKWYEVMYGERYMETEATNPEGFAATSLISRAKNLKGKLLICQGAIDETVVWEHSLSFIEACIRNGVQVDYFPYPTHPHNVSGKDRVHLMTKVTDYFEDHLK